MKTPTPLVMLWAINGATLACAIYAAPVPVLCGGMAVLAITASAMHHRYGKIAEPARALARAWVSGNSLCGAEIRDLAEAVFRWDRKAEL